MAYTLNGNKEIVGTNGADKATITKNNNYFWGKGGNDTITIKSGKSNYAYGGTGKNKLYIKGGSSNSIYGGTKKDFLSITGKGKDQYIHGGGGNDEITVNATSTGNNVYGEAGDDIINVKKAGKGLAIYGGAGKDKITVKNTASWEIYGANFMDVTGDKADTISVYSGKGSISGGAGSDKITLGKGVKNGISVNGDSAYGGTGNDTITVSYGSSHKIEGGKGQDFININKGKNHTLTADSNDRITLKKGTTASVINIENGNSAKLAGKVTLNSGSKAKLVLDNFDHKYSNKLTITAANGTVTDNTLYFTGQYQTGLNDPNYSFTQSGASLVINNQIYLENFASGAYSGGFVFSCDGRYPTSMSFEDIKKAANWK